MLQHQGQFIKPGWQNISAFWFLRSPPQTLQLRWKAGWVWWDHMAAPIWPHCQLGWFQFSPLYYLPTILKGNGHRSGPPHSNMSLQFLFLFCLLVIRSVLFLIARPRLKLSANLTAVSFTCFWWISQKQDQVRFAFCIKKIKPDFILMTINSEI